MTQNACYILFSYSISNVKHEMKSLFLTLLFILCVKSVWQKLEEENADFFRAYYIRLKLKKQIILFNHLLEHQYHLMKYPPGPPKVPLAPIQNGMHPMAPGNKSETLYHLKTCILITSKISLILNFTFI